MKYVICIALLFSGIFFAGCSSQSEQKSYEELNSEVLQSLINENFKETYKYFDKELQMSLPIEQLEEMWFDQTKNAGEFITIHDTRESEGTSSHTALETTLEFSQVIFESRVIFNDEKKIVSIHFTKGFANAVLPENVVEEEVTIGEGTEYPLKGTLTLPKNSTDLLPAVVLVHGSGPSDRDESAFGYKPFRDIAWGLAERGIATLRYDKRTFIYGSKMVTQIGKELTVKEETVEDAISAANLLKADSRIDKNSVYIIGHSLGGMLAPRIDDEGGDFAGLIILAGSVRPLWEIIYDQNMALLQANSMAINEEKRQENKEMIQEELEKGKNLLNMTEEDVKNETLFSMPAYYFYEMDMYGTKKIVADLEKPIFVLQGEDDFQVYYDKDFVLWEQLLEDKENATLKSYPGLNHFFVNYEGEHEGTVKEYEFPARVELQVIDDMANWIHDVSNNK